MSRFPIAATILAICCSGLLSSAAAVEPVTAQVRVVDGAGAPVSGVEVACIEWLSDGLPRSGPLPAEEKSITDAEGLCRFAGLAGDSYGLWLTRGPECAFDQVNRDELGKGVRALRLKPGVPVYGYVRTEDGTPLAGVVVSFYRRIPVAETDANGLFTIPVIPETPQLSLVKDGYAWREIPSWTRLEIVMEPGGIVQGQVLDDQKRPAAGAQIRYASEGNGFVMRTDENGMFKTPSLRPAKDAEFIAEFENEEAFFQGGVKTEIVAGETVSLTLVPEKNIRTERLSPEEAAAREREYLAQFTTVSGRVVDAGTKEPVQAVIYESDSNSNSEFDYYKDEAGHTAADGSFTIEKVRKGSQLFVMAAPDDPLLYPVEGIVRVEVGDEPKTGLTLTVAQGVAVGGKAVTAEGEPVVEGDVVLIGASEHRDHFLHDGNPFLFPNLAPGEYRLNLAEVSIETGRLDAGQKLDDFVLRLPPKDEGTLVEGTLVDEAGTPIGGVNVQMYRQEPPANASAETDAAGRFSTRVREPGTYKVSLWEVFSLVKPREHPSGGGQELPIAGSSELAVPATGPVTLQLTATRPPWPKPILAGSVRDETGKLLDAQVRLVKGESDTDWVQVQNGAFSVERLPEGPFLIEATLQEYEARVLEAGTDFQVDDRNLAIVLEKGPFEDGQSVWTQVTGRPATEEAQRQMAFAKYVRESEDNYRRMAAPLDQRPTPPAQPQAPNELKIRVSDLQGQPIKRIVVQRAEGVGYSGLPPSPLTAQPAHSSSSDIMSSDTGEYSVPNPSLVEAEGTARTLVFVEPGKPYEPPLALTLGPPARLVVVARDYQGKAVAGAVAGPADAMWQYEGSGYYGLPKSSDDGKIVFENLPAGDYWLSVAVTREADPYGAEIQWPLPPRLVHIVLWPGENGEREVVLPLAPKGTPEATLLEWERRVIQGSLRQPEFGEAVKALDVKQRALFGKLVTAQLAQLPGVGVPNDEQAMFFANLAAQLGDAGRSAVPQLKRLLETDFGKSQNPAMMQRWDTRITSSFIEAIVTLEGLEQTAYWVKLTRNAGASNWTRTQACAVLGRSGTDESIKAWLALRDAARTKPGAPPAKEQYTHAEKMAEAVIFAAGIIPDGPAVEPKLDTAWIDETKQNGRIEFNGNKAELRRFGNEWVVVKVEEIPIAIP